MVVHKSPTCQKQEDGSPVTFKTWLWGHLPQGHFPQGYLPQGHLLQGHLLQGLKEAGGLCVDLKMSTQFSRTCYPGDGAGQRIYLGTRRWSWEQRGEHKASGGGRLMGLSCGCKGQAISTPLAAPRDYEMASQGGMLEETWSPTTF